MLIINELSPAERFKEENIIIGGLWGDSEKPHPNVFLQPVYSEMKKVNEGFFVKIHGQEFESTVKGILLFGECDVPAKALFMNMKGHAGYCSCPRCLIRGEKSARTGQVMVFPHEESLTLRTDENYEECVKNAVQAKTEDRGVFGPTILSYTTYSSFIRSISIDSMHCLSLGIVKQLLKLWFDHKFAEEQFSLVNYTDRVNKLLQMLKLPHYVQRLPEDITKLHFWKASLCRNFLLYIAVVIMKQVMKPEYYANFSMLVNGISLLHKSSISMSDISAADLYLNEFSDSFQKLYGIRHMSSNIHLLRHLATSVVDCGNLCITNCFKFEDLNGKFLSLMHGTTHAIQQIYSNLTVLSELPLLVNDLKCEEVKEFCQKLTHRKYLSLTEKIGINTYVVGNLDGITQNSQEISEYCTGLFGPLPSFRTFSRIFKDGILYVSSSYQRGSRISSFCKYRCNDRFVHGKILSFVKVCECPPQYFALLSRSDNEPDSCNQHFVFSAATETTDFVPISNLLCVSWCLEVEGTVFLIDPLNMYEME